jgi:hypothetical protein
MAQKKKWADLSPTQQRIIVVSGIVEVVLTAYCLRDLRRRPADQVRGPKALWAPAMSVQPFGPLAYLTLGRRPA